MGKHSVVQVLYVTDANYLPPTLLSIWSFLRTLSGPAQLHVWGDGLSAGDWRDIRRLAAANPAVTLHEFDLTTFLAAARGPQGYISGATMGRLFIPRLLTGEVLYIDGDTLVVADVSPLFAQPLGAELAGVVRDYSVLQWLADAERRGRGVDRTARLDEIRGLMGASGPQDYFNAGVMIWNADAIRAEPELMAQVENVEAASACTMGDQDHLNRLFAGRVRFLDISWNLSWARARQHRAYFRKLGVDTHGAAAGPVRVIHYHGPQKPWSHPRRDFWSSRGRATLGYRRRLRDYARAFPDLAARLA